jgi:antitoxin FitA
MASLHVRNVDDEIVNRLKERAVRNGRSAEAEHREILRQALAEDKSRSFDELAAQIRKLLEGRKYTPSEVLIREDRDER